MVSGQVRVFNVHIQSNMCAFQMKEIWRNLDGPLKMKELWSYVVKFEFSRPKSSSDRT